MPRISLLLTFLSLPIAAFAHVGSPDVYFDGYAGPYHLLVTIRPPTVIPGVAEIQIRNLDSSKEVSEVQVLPLRMTGIAARLAPRPDVAERSSENPQIFRGKLWLMTRGSWKVQINVDGRNGKAELSVPVAAVSGMSEPMRKTLGILLACLGAFLTIGIVGIIGAANREADLDPGATPSAEKKQRGVWAMVFMAMLIVLIVIYGNLWWNSEAIVNARLAYKIPHVTASLAPGNVLRLHLQVPEDHEFARFRVESPERLRVDDFIPDHGHLMHLFLVRTPDMRSFWHLHPQQSAGGDFTQELPAIPEGHYQVFADVVHHTGFPETYVGQINLPGLISDPPNAQSDDAGGGNLESSNNVSPLADGYRMVWDKDTAPLRAKQATWFRFHIEDKNGKPATDLEDYMGMAGHAVFLRDDGRVFAHVHPVGSVSMAAADMAQSDTAAMGLMTQMHHSSSGEVTFPYGFPESGNYHIFVQIKRGGKVETGAFTAKVSP